MPIRPRRRITAALLGGLIALSVPALATAPAGAATGDITEFSAGITAGGAPADIASGPDGNLWFTELAGRIGRITTAGVVTEFSAGITTGSQPVGIASGPDGNLWFTECGGNRIGRITTAGVVTEFSTGITTGSLPRDITAGPDENLWFTEESGNRIGRITTTGVVTEFGAGITPGSQPNGIVTGPDGNLWFGEVTGDRVGRITPAGVVTEFASGISPASGPLRVAAGPDGNIWFTELFGDRIGRLKIDQADLRVRLRAPDHARLGSTYEYTLTVTNRGPDTARDVTVTLSRRLGLAVVGVSPAAHELTWRFGSLAPGRQRTFHVWVRAAGKPRTVTATAHVTAATFDPVPANNTATAGTRITQRDRD